MRSRIPSVLAALAACTMIATSAPLASAQPVDVPRGRDGAEQAPARDDSGSGRTAVVGSEVWARGLDRAYGSVTA